MQTSFYSYRERKALGLASCGQDVKISRKTSIYGTENIYAGDHIRIDDYCILSGKIVLGNYIHIAAYTALYGGNVGITMEDFTMLSSRCAVYAVSDDYSGESLTNPTEDERFRNGLKAAVHIERYAIVGSGTTILPDASLGEGSAVVSTTLVKGILPPWGIYAGIPAHKIKDRSRELLQYGQIVIETNRGGTRSSEYSLVPDVSRLRRRAA